MSNRFVKVPIYPRFFRVDLGEIEAYVAQRYQETFGEPPFGVEVEKYPGEIDIVVYTPELNDQTYDFKRMIQKELSDEGLPVLVVMNTRTDSKP